MRTVARCGVKEAFMNEDSCWDVYRPENSLTLMITQGYFLFDLTVILILARDFSPLGLQSAAHHVAGTICFFCAMSCGLDLPRAT